MPRKPVTAQVFPLSAVGFPTPSLNCSEVTEESANAFLAYANSGSCLVSPLIVDTDWVRWAQEVVNPYRKQAYETDAAYSAERSSLPYWRERLVNNLMALMRPMSLREYRIFKHQKKVAEFSVTQVTGIGAQITELRQKYTKSGISIPHLIATGEYDRYLASVFAAQRTTAEWLLAMLSDCKFTKDVTSVDKVLTLARVFAPMSSEDISEYVDTQTTSISKCLDLLDDIEDLDAEDLEHKVTVENMVGSVTEALSNAYELNPMVLSQDCTAVSGQFSNIFLEYLTTLLGCERRPHEPTRPSYRYISCDITIAVCDLPNFVKYLKDDKEVPLSAISAKRKTRRAPRN